MTKISQADAYEIVAGRASIRLILLCDHASSAVPEAYGDLGLAPTQFERHIAYDIGARDLTLGLADRLAANRAALETLYQGGTLFSPEGTRQGRALLKARQLLQRVARLGAALRVSLAQQRQHELFEQ